MKTDTYTKFILTLIAICLLIIVMKEINFFSAAYANNTEKKQDFTNNYGLVPLNEDGSINVRLNYGDYIDVRLRGIDEAPNLRWEAIKVKVTN